MVSCPPSLVRRQIYLRFAGGAMTGLTDGLIEQAGLVYGQGRFSLLLAR